MSPWFPHLPSWVWWACTGSNVLFGGQLVALAILWTLVAQRRTAALRPASPAMDGAKPTVTSRKHTGRAARGSSPRANDEQRFARADDVSPALVSCAAPVSESPRIAQLCCLFV